MLPWQLSTDSCCGINGPLFDPGYQHLFPFLLRVRDQGVTVWVTSGGLHQQVRVGPYSQNCGRGPDPILLGPLAPITPLMEAHRHLGLHFQASVPFLG